jgi:hypothetical protein
VNALLFVVLAPSAFGIPGALAGWIGGRRGAINACTAVGGVALARHAQNRDSHLT